MKKNLTTYLLSIFSTLSFALAAEEPQSTTPSWDVLQPQGTTKTIHINTQEVTWSNLDVSPNGKTLVFDMLGDLYQVSIDGGKATALTEDFAWNIQPKFSPDGKTIAFISDRDGNSNLWLFDIKTQALTQVTKESDHAVHNPEWHHDGQYIALRKAYMGARSIAGGSIWMYHKTGGEGIQLRKPLDDKQPQKNLSEPEFSQDGRYLYFSLDATPGQQWQYGKNSIDEIFQIHRIDLHKGEEETVVSGPGGALRPQLSPDNQSLAFVRRVEMQSALYIKDLASGLEKQIYLGLDRDLQEGNGEHGNTPAYTWMPNGKSLVFSAAGKIHRIDTDGSNHDIIPITVATHKQVNTALRLPVDVAPENFDIKMIRWAQPTPNGKKVVFQALGKLYVRDLSSGKVKRLTKQNDHFEFYPQLSHDGKSVVYTTWDDEKLGSVRTAKLRNGKGRTLTSDPGHYIYPRFSHDDKHIVFQKITGGYLLSSNWSLNPGIYTVSSKGDDLKRVTKKGIKPQFNQQDDRIFYLHTEGETNLQLHSVDLNGYDQRQHYAGDYVSDYLVSPDNQWLAYIQDYQVYLTPFIQSGQSLTLTPSTTAFPVQQVSKHSGDFLQWQSDSQSISWGFGPTLYQKQLQDSFAYLNKENNEANLEAITTHDLSFTQSSDKPEGLLALVGGRIVTMRNAQQEQEVINNGVILIQDNRIQAVGKQSDITIPKQAKVIDITGKTVIPGLVDVHAHGSYGSQELQPEQNWHQYSYLSFGVTTIHDPSTSTTEVFSLSELSKAGKAVTPRLYSTGRILYAGNFNFYKAKINSYDDALFHVNRLKAAGAISVKSYAHPRRSTRQQVMAAGRELGIMVVPEGTGKFQLNMNQIVDGHTGIEHAVNIPNFYDDVKQLWSQTEVGYTPTLGVAYGGLEGEKYWYQHTNVWENKRLMAFTPEYVVKPYSIRPPKAPESHYNHIQVASEAKKLRDLGVKVLLGAHGQREGLAAHWELWMLGQGGFTPWEALRAGTIDGAWYIGLDKDLGSIEPGKLADLAILDGDVLNNLRDSEQVTHTVINGRIYDAATMNEVGRYNHKRQPFFFENAHVQSMHPATARYMQKKAEMYHWQH